MGLTILSTTDCKQLVITVTDAPSGGNNEIAISLNGTQYRSFFFPGGQPSYQRVVALTTLGVPPDQDGVFTVEHKVDGQTTQIGGVLLGCRALCCLAKKLDSDLDCGCTCTQCSNDFVDAQRIFMLLETAEAELATASGAGTLQSVQAVIRNASDKYNKAVELCGNSCGCNC